MNTKNLYAVKDLKAKIYDAYMILDNDAQAVRSFAQACDTNEVFKKWPEDFELYKIAEINKEEGFIVPLEKPSFMCAATSFVPKNEQNN